MKQKSANQVVSNDTAKIMMNSRGLRNARTSLVVYLATAIQLLIITTV